MNELNIFMSFLKGYIYDPLKKYIKKIEKVKLGFARSGQPSPDQRLGQTGFIRISSILLLSARSNRASAARSGGWDKIVFS